MYVIVVYDVEAKKCAKIHKYLKQRFFWIQNSAFEGEATFAQLRQIKADIKKLIAQDEKVTFFEVESKKLLNKEELGAVSLTSNIV